MKKSNRKYLTVLVLIINVLFIYKIHDSYATGKYIYGKVVYSDDLTPVSSGNIRVFKFSESGKMEIEIENTTVESNGEFKIVEPELLDGVKIMAYPNQFDNIQNPFEQRVIDYEVAMVDRINEHRIIIEVQRINNNQSPEKSDSQEKDNIILKQNFPNPFNPSTSIRFDLPNKSKVTLKVYNMNGANVATLVENKNLNAGINEFEFNAGDLPSGIYIYRLSASGYTENRKMILVK